MIVGYVVYIFIINPVESDRLYYLLTSALDFFIGLFMVWIYLNKDYIIAKYLAFCSFASFFIHVYGRIIYDFDGDTKIYVLLCVLVVITKISFMLIRPLSNGISRDSNRGSSIRFNGCLDQECNIEMHTKKGCN